MIIFYFKVDSYFVFSFSFSFSERRLQKKQQGFPRKYMIFFCKRLFVVSSFFNFDVRFQEVKC